MPLTPNSEQVRDALAIAIVRERRKMANDIEYWKQRATRAEEELRTVRGEPPDTFLKRLPRLDAKEKDSSILESAVEDVRQRRITLHAFLKNVHALRTAQTLHKSGKEIGETALWDLVSDFVTSSLVRLAPGQLRTAYIQHAVEYFSAAASDAAVGTQADYHRCMAHLIATTLDQITNEEQNRVEVAAIKEFLVGLLKIPCCIVPILQSVVEANLQRIQSLAQSAVRFRDTHPVSDVLSRTERSDVQKAELEATQCEAFLNEIAFCRETIQSFFQLQEAALEQMVLLICRSATPLPFSHDWVDPVVRSMLHAQQYVETLEIFAPDLAASLHFSTATLIAALQRIGAEEQLPDDRSLYRSACIARSKAIRDFYMPLGWGSER